MRTTKSLAQGLVEASAAFKSDIDTRQDLDNKILATIQPPVTRASNEPQGNAVVPRSVQSVLRRFVSSLQRKSYSEYLWAINDARRSKASVYSVAIESRLMAAPYLSQIVGTMVFLKREDEQAIRSYKIRGAYYKIACLSAEERARGVVCASAGNHAQGVALSARLLKCHATIFVPKQAPQQKIDAIRWHGGGFAEVIPVETFKTAVSEAQRFAQERGAVLVHPFDDPSVIAGAGTIGLELVDQIIRMGLCGPVAVFVPVGGGGLLSGLLLAIRQTLKDVRVFGVEPEGSSAMSASLRKGRVVDLGEVDCFADGVAVPKVGRETFRLVRGLLREEIILVSTAEIAEAAKLVFDDCRGYLEPAGALAFAGLKKAYANKALGIKGPAIAIVSGGNCDPEKWIAMIDPKPTAFNVTTRT